MAASKISSASQQEPMKRKLLLPEFPCSIPEAGCGQRPQKGQSIHCLTASFIHPDTDFHMPWINVFVPIYA